MDGGEDSRYQASYWIETLQIEYGMILQGGLSASVLGGSSLTKFIKDVLVSRCERMLKSLERFSNFSDLRIPFSGACC